MQAGVGRYHNKITSYGWDQLINEMSLVIVATEIMMMSLSFPTTKTINFN